MESCIHNFDFFNKTRVVFGKNQIAMLPQLISKDRIVFMTYGGGSIKRNGVYDQVKKALDGYEIIEFGGIEPNPDFDTLMKAVNIIHTLDISRVHLLSVGGGSVNDGTKFIAAASYLKDEEEAWDMVLKGASFVTKAIPIGCILTLPATGSESNNGAMISRRSMKMKCGIRSNLMRPTFCILDPLTTFSLPERQTANGVVDSFVHVCEQYITVCSRADVQDRYCEALMKVLIENGRIVMKNPEDYAARANVMWASTQALNHWLSQGVTVDWATHNIGHELTAYLGMDHACTLACIQPRVLQYNFEAKKEKLAQMGRRVFDLEGEDDEVARKCIDAIVDFYENDMHIPTRISKFVDNDDRAWIDEVFTKFTKRGLNFGENQLFTPEVACKVIQDSY